MRAYILLQFLFARARNSGRVHVLFLAVDQLSCWSVDYGLIRCIRLDSRKRTMKIFIIRKTKNEEELEEELEDKV